MNEKTLRRIIAGAIYDFAGRLTTRRDPLTLGAAHNAAPAAEACDEFLKLRGCSDGEPLVREWQNLLDAPPVSVAQAMETIKAAMRDDYDYAWTWHCNLACAAQDEGLNHEAGNKAAARFMQIAFGIDTSKGR